LTAPQAEAEVAVLGGGVMAGTVAHVLAASGRRTVIVPDAAPAEIGHAASGPFVPYREVARSLGRDGAHEVWRLFRESHERLRAFLAQAPRDCGYRPNGAFLLAEDRAQGLSLAESEDMLRDDGFPGEFLDRYMLESRFDLTGFAAAYWAADDAELDAPQLAALLREAAARSGATVAEVGAVRAIEDGPVIRGDDGTVRAERIVLASDAATGLAGLPLVAVAEAEAPIETGAALPGRARAVSGAFGFQAADGIVRVQVTGTAAELDLRLARFPAHARKRSSGEVLATRDGLPRIGPAAGGGLLLACGPEAVGLAFAAARWIEELLRSGHDPTPGPLRAARVESPGSRG